MYYSIKTQENLPCKDLWKLAQSCKQLNFLRPSDTWNLPGTDLLSGFQSSWEFWNPLSKTVLSKCVFFFFNKRPVYIWNDHKTRKWLLHQDLLTFLLIFDTGIVIKYYTKSMSRSYDVLLHFKSQGVGFTNVLQALQNILSKFVYCWNHTSYENFKLQLSMCAQNFALGTCTKFQLVILTINVISCTVCFHEIFLKSSWNISETTPWSICYLLKNLHLKHWCNSHL